MEDTLKIPLVTSEIAGLRNSYMGESMAVCVLKYFLNRVDDSETQAILQSTLKLSNKHIQLLVIILNQAKLPIPEGFTDKDVNINAPRLYNDEFYLFYLSFMSRTKMIRYAQILSNCARTDIRDYFTNLMVEASDLYNYAIDIRLSKGVFTRFPQVEVSKKIEYIKSINPLMDWFGEKRSLFVDEITQVSVAIIANTVGSALTTGFGQVCMTNEISKYMFKGRDMFSKKIDLLSSLLTSENIPIPSTSYSSVTDSKVPPFSEKLMMFHVLTLGSISIVNDGIAMAETLRTDLSNNYMKFLTEDIKYSKDGGNIMIEKGWFEKPPQAINH